MDLVIAIEPQTLIILSIKFLLEKGFQFQIAVPNIFQIDTQSW